MRGLYDRWRHLVHEIAKFGVVGAVAYVVDFGIFNALDTNGVGPVTSKAISTVVAATVAYFGNRHWSFTHRARTGVRREYTIFIVISAVGLGIALASTGFGVYVLGQHSRLAKNIWANLVGTGLGTIFRYWAYKQFVFLAPDHPKALSLPDPAAKAAAAEAADSAETLASASRSHS